MNSTENDNIPQGFTPGMALMDLLPVVFFYADAVILASRFRSILFLVGAILVILAGSLKVLWKFVLALAKKDITFLNRQMRYLMPAGFIVMAAALVIDHTKWSASDALHHILSFPSILFFLAAAAGLCLMVYFARHLNGRDAHSNWIEQGVNTLAQLFVFLGILL